MHLLVVLLVLLTMQQPPTDPSRVRLLLRDDLDAGVAGATLMIRTTDSQTYSLTTDATGVALSGALTGEAVWLLGGHLAEGVPLVADSYPADAGFRLVLIPGATRDVLLRLDGDRIVLDPDMIFSPGEPGEVPPPTPAALAAPTPPMNDPAPPMNDPALLPAPPPLPALVGGAEAGVAPDGTAPPLSGLLWILLGSSLVLVGVAFMIGLARRRMS